MPERREAVTTEEFGPLAPNSNSAGSRSRSLIPTGTANLGLPCPSAGNNVARSTIRDNGSTGFARLVFSVGSRSSSVAQACAKAVYWAFVQVCS